MSHVRELAFFNGGWHTRDVTAAWIHRPVCDSERVVTEEVPFDLGKSELLTLRNSLPKGHFVDAIVAYGREDGREVR